MFAICLPFSVFAQDNRDIDKVDIYTKYKPSLIDAKRIESQPELKEPEPRDIKPEYRFPDFRYKVNPAFTPIPAQSYKYLPSRFVSGNFVKAGFGNYTTPLLHLELHNGRNRNYAYGVSAYHLSSNGPAKRKQQSFADDRIQVHGARFTRGNTLSGRLGYSRLGYHYYGYNTDENVFRRDSVRQVQNYAYGNLHFDNHNSGKKFKTQSDLDAYHFSTRSQNELGYRLSTRNGGRFYMGELFGDLAIEGIQTGPDSLKYSRHFIDIHPYFKMKYKQVDLTLGAIGTLFIDSLGSSFYLYPEFRADYYVVPEKMKAYAGINGNLGRASLKSTYQENPFLADYQPLRNDNTSYHIYAGVKGKLANGLDYTLELSQKFTHNFILFANDTFPLHKFLLLYDDVNIFKFQAGLNYTRFNKLNLGTFFTYYAYNGDAAQAYQRPDFEWNTFVSGTLNKKLELHGKFYVIGNRYAFAVGSFNGTKLKPIADINIGADYRYKKDLSFFIDLNNITNQTYQRWNNYPVYGLNGVAGLTFSF